MTWRDRDDSDDDTTSRHSAWGRPGGDWAGLRPSIDNPLTWSVPIMRVGGVVVRVHLLFLAFVVVQLCRALVPAQGQIVDFGLTAVCMGVLLVVVLAHEFGHVLACRAVDGHADEILMWPLGGLAFAHPPYKWQAHFFTALGGPLVNLTIFALASPLLALSTHQWWGVAIPNPLNPLEYINDPLIARSWAHILLYMLNALSVMLLTFNLLPMFPLDGGRLLQALLWARMGWSQSMRYAVRAGFVVGLALAIFGGMTYNWVAVAVAVFGLVACYQTERQLAFSDSALDLESDEYAIDGYAALDPDEPEEPPAKTEPASSASVVSAPPPSTQSKTSSRPQTNVANPDAAEIDRILQKIAASGLGSLTQREHELLQQETERKRRGG